MRRSPHLPYPAGGTNLFAVKTAPCGSVSTVVRTHGASIGGTTTVAPSSAALAMRKELDLVLFPIDWGQEDAAVTLVWREAGLGNPALVALLDCF